MGNWKQPSESTNPLPQIHLAWRFYGLDQDVASPGVFFFLNIYLFIWLCQVLVAARGIFVAVWGIFSCGMQDLLVAACELLVAACGI